MAWAIVSDPHKLGILMASAYNGMGGVREVMPDVTDAELDSIGREFIGAKLVNPYVAGTDSEGRLDVDTKISAFGAFVLKTSWQIAA